MICASSKNQPDVRSQFLTSISSLPPASSRVSVKSQNPCANPHATLHAAEPAAAISDAIGERGADYQAQACIFYPPVGSRQRHAGSPMKGLDQGLLLFPVISITEPRQKLTTCERVRGSGLNTQH